MKIVKTIDGMLEPEAQALWRQIEGFAAYSFNKSHAVEYTIISMWTAYMRTHYPAEYFAACLSIVDDDKLAGLVNDARECGIEVLPPDINASTDRFTIPDDHHLLAPFSKVKGISENTARRIVELREKNRGWKVVRVKRKRDGTTEDVYGPDEASPVKGRFDTIEEFLHTAGAPGSKINSRVVENLRAVGALAYIEPGSKPPRDLSRRKDQVELMPGLIIDTVKADRSTDVTEPFVKAKIIHIVQDYRGCSACDLAGQPHPAVRMKSNVKFMVVSDCPNWQEEKANRLMEGDTADCVKTAIKNAGLTPGDGYFTALVKAKKNDKFLTNAQLNGCAQYLNRELEVIKPAVIVALGSASIKRFLPGLKGGSSEMVGKAVYDAKLDATIICGINPAQIYHDPAKQAVLDMVFEKVAEVLS